ncbi:MAG: SRPBCC family protein [Ardenticatenaceae bacterium]
MTRIYNAIHIERPVEEVFDYVTTPGNWPRWHPSSLAVRGATDHSLTVGEAVTEAFSVAGRREEVVWTVTERAAPQLWTIEGQIVGREGGGTVRYRLQARNGGTWFEREFTYPTRGLLFTLLDLLLIRRRVRKESTEAVARLKEVLEAAPGIRARI